MSVSSFSLIGTIISIIVIALVLALVIYAIKAIIKPGTKFQQKLDKLEEDVNDLKNNK
ncbi:hypothetical protein GCM10008983_18650 [Lentibacillus halophilus]|uniref:DUF4083 domain-containing protein n=1 Tax=Lentibacillus halophilus TaxID=295065 RepID=A0ABP3J4J9_9BACI